MAEVRRGLTRYLAEFFVIFIGVWLGFLADDLRDKRQDRADERVSLARVLEDLDVDRGDIEGNRARAEMGEVAARRLLAPTAAQLPADTLLEQLGLLQQHSVLAVNASEYTALKSAGRLMIIRDEEVRRLLTSLYESYPVIAVVHDREYEALRHAMLAASPHVRIDAPSGDAFPLVSPSGDPHGMLSDPVFRASVAELASYRLFLNRLYSVSLERLEQVRGEVARQLR